MSNNYAPYFNIINFVIPSYIELISAIQRLKFFKLLTIIVLLV